MERARTSPSRRLWLTERDQKFLDDLLASSVVTRDQILALGYFHSIARLNARLRLLVKEGYVRRVEGTRLGTRQTLYACGPAAAPALCLSSGRPIGEIEHRLRRAPGLLFLEHTLRITDIRIALLQAAQELGWSLNHWLSEARCFHDYSISSRRRVLKPDGFARISSPAVPLDFFVEADCGNVSLGRFAEKIRAYEHYGQLGVYRETYRNDSFAVLVVTTGNERALHLKRLVENANILVYVHIFGSEALSRELMTLLESWSETAQELAP